MLLATQRLVCWLRLKLTHTSAGLLAVAFIGLKYNGAYKTEKVRNSVLLLGCLVLSRFLHNSDKAENSVTLLRMQGLSSVSGFFVLLCFALQKPVQMICKQLCRHLSSGVHVILNEDARIAVVVQDVS